MTIKDINDIINAVCPNDEDYEKPCISPKYLRQELEQLALDQEQKYLEQEPTTRNCFGCKYSKDNHNARTEECHLCMWESQYKPKTGRWVEENINEWSRKVYCSECGCPPPFEHISSGDVYSASGYGVINKTKYCPNCGAKMESEV